MKCQGVSGTSQPGDLKKSVRFTKIHRLRAIDAYLYKEEGGPSRSFGLDDCGRGDRRQTQTFSKKPD